MKRSPFIALLLSVLTVGPLWAQPRKVQTGEPVSTVVAMSGIVVVGAGFGMMLHANDRMGQTNDAWILGGIVVVGAGVTMVWLGLRSQTVVVSPSVQPRSVGVTGTIRWGGAR